MRNAIIEKLNKELLKEIEIEAQVVYILVETRKIIKEHDSNVGRYPILAFFCDWVVHVKMDRRGAKQMLGQVRNFYTGLDSYLHIKKNTSFFPFVMFIVLRRELRIFLENNDLPLNIVNDDEKWEKCLFLLLDVIIDCPLMSSTGYVRECRFVGYSSEDEITCKLKLQGEETQTFVSKNKFDFIESN